MADLHSRIFPRAKENIETAQTRQKRDYATRHRSKSSFEVGEEVLLWDSRRSTRKGGKDKDPWTGPYVVSEKKGNLYVVKSKDTQQQLKQKLHGSNLKKFVMREEKAEESLKEDIETDQSEEPKKAPLTKFRFMPTDGEWRKEASARLGLKIRAGSFHRGEAGPLGEPVKIDSIAAAWRWKLSSELFPNKLLVQRSTILPLET